MAQQSAKKSGIKFSEAIMRSEKIKLIKYAADLLSQSFTSFVINSAHQSAKRVLQEHQQLHLSLKDRDIFIQALLNPSKPTNKLLKANKKYKSDVLSK